MIEKKTKKQNILHLPVLCALAGITTGVVVTLFKFCINLMSKLSVIVYSFIRQRPQFIPVLIAGLAVCAFLIFLLIKKAPDIKGGGIPRAEGILRGLITFKWLRVLIGTFVSGLLTFISGLSLGTEGPSVMIAAAAGKGISQRYPVLSRYVMTGTSAAGFSVATGAPLSGIVFVLEEIHKRFSLLLLSVVMLTVACATVTANILSPLLQLDTTFFSIEPLTNLPLELIWLPVVIGLFAGLIASLFNRSMDALNRFFEVRLKRVNRFIKIFAVLILTAIAVIFLPETLGSGHHLIEKIIDCSLALATLILLFVVKIILITLAANSGATGGIFISVLVIGAIGGGILFKVMNSLGMPTQYCAVVVIMCMCATLGASMHAPITAMVFIIEITGANYNSLFFIVSVLVAVIVIHLFKTESLNDIMLDKILRQQDGNKQASIIECTYEVGEGSFLVGKTVRDILFPPNCIIKSFIRKGAPVESLKMVKGGDKVFKCGDIVLLQLQTYDEQSVKKELSLLFEQKEVGE